MTGPHFDAEMERGAVQGDETTFIRLDVEMNTLIAAAGRNVYTTAALMPLHALSRRFWFIHHRETATDLSAAARLHADVLRAIAAGDEAGVARTTDILLDWVEQFTRGTP